MNVFEDKLNRSEKIWEYVYIWDASSWIHDDQPLWKIERIEFDDEWFPTTKFAEWTNFYNKKWTDKLTYNYS
jgi:hypothetical protein